MWRENLTELRLMGYRRLPFVCGGLECTTRNSFLSGTEKYLVALFGFNFGGARNTIEK